MRDLFFKPQKRETKLGFGDFMFRGFRPRPFNFLNRKEMEMPVMDMEKKHDRLLENHDNPKKTDINQKNNFPKEQKPSSLKFYNTISGNFILTRGWEGNNMSIFRMRKRQT